MISTSQHQEVSYNAELTKQMYDKRYSSFQFLPSFNNEYKKIVKTFSNILNKYKISPASLHSYLDLGCGMGVKTYCLSSFFDVSKGVDISERAIQIASLLNDKPDLTFEVSDVNTSSSVEKFDIITALGLSVLNVSNLDQYYKEVLLIQEKYLKNQGYLIIYSFTDYSGKALTGWYNHTRNELHALLKQMNNDTITCKLYFPHRNIHSYFGHGVDLFLAEIYRKLKSKRRDYYFIIQKHGGK